jgi:hypothetical protein
MKGTLSLFVESINGNFSNGFEFKDDEYLKALQSYEAVDFNNMMGVECFTSETSSIKVKDDNYREVGCLCNVLDELGVYDISIDDIFNIVYSNHPLKKVTLMVDYDEMDMEFEDDFVLWVGDSERLMKQAVNVFGNGILPMKNLYFEFLNKNGEKIKLLFENSIFLNKKQNKITIGCKNIKIVE